MANKEQRTIQFLIDARTKIDEIIELAEHYDLKEDLIAAISVGIIKETTDNGDFHKIDAITSIFADNEEELASMLYHMSRSFKEDDGEDETGSIDFWMNFGDDSLN